MFPEEKELVQEEVGSRGNLSKVTLYNIGQEVIPDCSKHLSEDESLTTSYGEITYSDIHRMVALKIVYTIGEKLSVTETELITKQNTMFLQIPIEEYEDYFCRCYSNNSDILNHQFTVCYTLVYYSINHSDCICPTTGIRPRWGLSYNSWF